MDGRRSGADEARQRGRAGAPDQRELGPLTPRELSAQERDEKEAADDAKAEAAEREAAIVEAVGRMSPEERATFAKALAANPGHPGDVGGDGSLSFAGRVTETERLAAAPAAPPIIRTANLPRTPIAVPTAPVPSPDHPDTTIVKDDDGVIRQVGHLERAER